jgi:glycosyltransferase involved in cell wall biosynthesis
MELFSRYQRNYGGDKFIKKMKILLIGNYPNDKQKSMFLLPRMIKNELEKKGLKVHLITPRVFFGKFFNNISKLSKILGYLDKYLIFPFDLKKKSKWADVVHICDHSNADYIKYIGKKPVVVTCNDVFGILSGLGKIPQNPVGITAKVHQRIVLKYLARANKIACISESTQNQLVNLIKKCSNKISVIYLGLNYNYYKVNKKNSNSHLEKLGLKNKQPFFLHVGGNQWYKNRSGVLKIFYHLIKYKKFSNFYLVMAGKAFTAEMNEFVKQKKLNNKVFEIINVSQEQLRVLYSNACALIYPSLAEGFGWPIIEAQACGCLVFTTNKPPMSEIGKNSVIYIDSTVHKIAAMQIFKKIELRDNYIKKGFKNIKQFSNLKMIDKYITVYENLKKERRL